ncbi:hypothetical protein LSCM1_07751 [Leishmania martiniquensis]|uniref:Vta1/callose synthase N-terminal domain-containing protein n=1 Tax=Leishmania martiniquensis TaxID=1580590 RepID=A0A836H5A0_9TRYP|nr:hypothetical protein LSCM1_07751 [Leishmania martiniquensis]
MLSPSSLLERTPPAWASMARPFLLRAQEFDSKEPLVAYFLCTHVAFLCVRQRKREDKAGTNFLVELLGALEARKTRLAAQLQGVDGRTVLTKCALMLFARADDAERTGHASMAIVRLFYTASVLFEATAQFTDDGAMDSIAAQKSKYAKYMATLMKKALDTKVPYVSPNKLESVDDDAGCGGRDADGAGQAATFTTAPANCFARPTPQPTSDSYRVPAPSATQGSTGPPYMPPPAYTCDDETQLTGKASVQPPPMQSMHAPSTSQQPPQLSTAQSSPAVPSTVPTSSTLPSTPRKPFPAQPRQQNVAPPSGGGAGATGFKPSVDQMIDAQKFASQAVSALQFYDYENAKQQLVGALRMLNGVQ